MRSEIELSFTERARREQILGATIELLAEVGYAATSLSAIAARIGTSKGVISYHFDGKDELLAQVVKRVLDDAAMFMGPRVDTASGAPAKLRAYVESNLQFLGEHRNNIRALTAILSSLAPGPGDVPAYAAAGRDAVEALAALLRSGQAAGDFRNFAPLVVARSLRASIDAVPELLRAEPDLDVRSYADELLALFEPGVLA